MWAWAGRWLVVVGGGVGFLVVGEGCFVRGRDDFGRDGLADEVVGLDDGGGPIAVGRQPGRAAADQGQARGEEGGGG